MEPAVMLCKNSFQLHIKRNGVDVTKCEQKLTKSEWSLITITEDKEGKVEVWINDQRIVNKELAPFEAKRGPLYASDPWNSAAVGEFQAANFQLSKMSGEDIKKTYALEKDTVGQWTLVTSKVQGSEPFFFNYDLGETSVNRLWKKQRLKIFKRICLDCEPTHREIFYRRLSPMTGFNAYRQMTSKWTSSDNVMDKDFELFSSFEDAMKRENKWKFCNYNDPGIGFPRDCGPTKSTGGQWNSFSGRGGHSVAFYVLTKPGIQRSSDPTKAFDGSVGTYWAPPKELAKPGSFIDVKFIGKVKVYEMKFLNTPDIKEFPKKLQLRWSDGEEKDIKLRKTTLLSRSSSSRLSQAPLCASYLWSLTVPSITVRLRFSSSVRLQVRASRTSFSGPRPLAPVLLAGAGVPSMQLMGAWLMRPTRPLHPTTRV
jgi:hypothetical protein